MVIADLDLVTVLASLANLLRPPAERKRGRKQLENAYANLLCLHCKCFWLFYLNLLGIGRESELFCSFMILSLSAALLIRFYSKDKTLGQEEQQVTPRGMRLEKFFRRENKEPQYGIVCGQPGFSDAVRLFKSPG